MGYKGRVTRRLAQEVEVGYYEACLEKIRKSVDILSPESLEYDFSQILSLRNVSSSHIPLMFSIMYGDPFNSPRDNDRDPTFPFSFFIKSLEPPSSSPYEVSLTLELISLHRSDLVWESFPR